MQRDSSFIPHKFKGMKVYGSSEWLANKRKKYRRVYDKTEATYVYCEISFYNKLYDEEDWNLKLNLKAFALRSDGKKELCNIPIDKDVSKNDHIVYIREGWGNKKKANYWKEGSYIWEAYIGEELIGFTKFHIIDGGIVTEDHNPYYKIESIKLFESSDKSKPLEDRVYYKTFDSADSRFVFVEFNFQNLLKEKDWHCELFFNFYNDARQLKGETIELKQIKAGTETFTITSGWGSETKGTWFHDNYTVEIVFMDKLTAILPFEIGDGFVEGMNEAYLPDATGSTVVKRTIETEQSFEEVMKELDALIGLDGIKTKIKEYADYLNFLKIREEKGFEDGQQIDLHAVFTGNPGTGKTTVAKLLGKIYYNLGLLSKGHVHEVDRADLVGEYIGQTAPKVKAAIKKARGGIMFIDEAYSLARSKDDPKDFGREVIEILIKEMSDGTGDLAVIVAGYPAEIKTFIESNPGMHSRFTHWFEFPDYTPQELGEISVFTADRQNVSLSTQSKAFLYDKIVESYRTRNRFFGNARYVNQLIKEAKINLGIRIMKEENPRALSKEELSTLRIEDFEKLFEKRKKILPDIPIDEDSLKAALTELNDMIGLASVKKDIEELVNLVRFYKEEKEEVLNRFSLHTVFIGHPGTGKTTVARIIAKIYKSLGVLERGHLVEVDRQSLVAGYIGQTAMKTAEKIDESIGGVLFIDEAYALSQRGSNDFGQEAIETLLKRMEDQKGEFAVIVAGYPKNMKTFLDSNPGLKSRFDRVLTFEEFNVEELMEITVAMFKEHKLKVQAKAIKQLREYFTYLHNVRNEYFGNGRVVRQTISEVIKLHNLRIAKIAQKDRTPKVRNTITFDDVKDFNESRDVQFGSGNIGFSVGGG